MRFYERFILPKVVNLACSMKPNMRQRARVVPLAQGRVLEVGSGSGLNLPFYDPSKVQHLWALDPSPEMWTMATKKARAVVFPVEFLRASAEDVPLAGESADTVLVTYTLCTIPDVLRALREIRRVLRPGGELLFCEHGAAPDESVLRWQNRLNPIWRRLGGGCNLNRPIPTLVEQGGFRILEMSSTYLPGWKPASFNYWGTAISGRLATP